VRTEKKLQAVDSWCAWRTLQTFFPRKHKEEKRLKIIFPCHSVCFRGNTLGIRLHLFSHPPGQRLCSFNILLAEQFIFHNEISLLIV
jgi:hypothetical protein